MDLNGPDTSAPGVFSPFSGALVCSADDSVLSSLWILSAQNEGSTTPTSILSVTVMHGRRYEEQCTAEAASCSLDPQIRGCSIIYTTYGQRMCDKRTDQFPPYDAFPPDLYCSWSSDLGPRGAQWEIQQRW